MQATNRTGRQLLSTSSDTAPPLLSSSATSFSGMISQLGSAIIIIPVIAILESVAIAKAFAGGKPVDASQEMLALGLCNIFGSFVQSMPTTGSFSRTAVNSASGVRTPLGGVYTGALVILCLAFLMPATAYIPKASLAAVIITAVIFSVEHHIIRPIWRTKRSDLIPGFVCFLVCLFHELELGIAAGVAVQLLVILYHSARPPVEVDIKTVPRSGRQYLSIMPRGRVLFPAVSYVRGLVGREAGLDTHRGLPVVVDCSHIESLDYTAAAQFKDLLADLHSRQQQVFWLRPSSEVAATLRPLAGELLVVITAVEQVEQVDQRDGGEEEPLLEKSDQPDLAGSSV